MTGSFHLKSPTRYPCAARNYATYVQGCTYPLYSPQQFFTFPHRAKYLCRERGSTKLSFKWLPTDRRNHMYSSREPCTHFVHYMHSPHASCTVHVNLALILCIHMHLAHFICIPHYSQTHLRLGYYTHSSRASCTLHAFFNCILCILRISSVDRIALSCGFKLPVVLYWYLAVVVPSIFWMFRLLIVADQQSAGRLM